MGTEFLEPLRKPGHQESWEAGPSRVTFSGLAPVNGPSPTLSSLLSI